MILFTIIFWMYRHLSPKVGPKDKQ